MHKSILFLLHIFFAPSCANVEISENNGFSNYEKPRVDIPSLPDWGSVPVEKVDLASSTFHMPIKLTDEERDLMRLNNPVVINYLARPEQMLILMEH